VQTTKEKTLIEFQDGH